MAYSKHKKFKLITVLAFAFILATSFNVHAQAQKIKMATPDSVAATISKLPQKERLFVFVNTIVGSNYILLDIAKRNRAKLGSIDEQEELRVALAKAKFMYAIQQKIFPNKFGTYFPDWIKTIEGYLSGKITFVEFVEKRKNLHPYLQGLLKSELKETEAQKLGTKHTGLIKELSQSFILPALRTVRILQVEDVKNEANYTKTLCLHVKEKWKKCGLTGDVKQTISKLKNQVADGNGKIYKTMRIGEKFVVYVIYKQTKKQMEEALKDLIEKQPTALSATFSLNAAVSLCADPAFTNTLKKTKSTGQVIVHSSDLRPIANLRFKNCDDLKKLTSANKVSKDKK